MATKNNMIKLIKYVSHPDLCGQIVNQFAFMIAMSRPEDSNFLSLHKLSLDSVYSKAYSYFIEYTTLEEIIDTEKCSLTERITEFLQEWKSVVDITAIQQNIHYDLMVLDCSNLKKLKTK